MKIETDTGRSAEFFQRLAESMPGANTRTATYFAPYPLTITEGDGAFVTDLDGNRYIDFLNNYTSLIHGHRAPKIVEAVAVALQQGTVFPAPLADQAELAERLCSRIESVDLVRFTNSGTEANMNAIACARAVTGRERVVKVHHGYHGSWEGLPPSLASAAATPRCVLDLIDWVEFNDTDGLNEIMSNRGEEVAAVILEPVLGAGVIPGEPEFFRTARSATEECEALLILDEVVTLRLEHAGYQSRFGIEPDLTTFGKLIGGGLPIGAFGGKKDVMEIFDPRRVDCLSHHGTVNGNTLSMAAGVASLDLLTREEIERVNALGDRVADILAEETLARDLDATVTRDGSLVQIHFEVGEEGVKTGSDLNPASIQLRQFHRAALEEGVYIAPRGELNLTTAMDGEIVDEAISGLIKAMDRITTPSV